MSENVGASTSRNLKGLDGLYRDNVTLPLPFTREIKGINILRAKLVVENIAWNVSHF
jgi:hypothetical protein